MHGPGRAPYRAATHTWKRLREETAIGCHCNGIKGILTGESTSQTGLSQHVDLFPRTHLTED